MKHFKHKLLLLIVLLLTNAFAHSQIAHPQIVQRKFAHPQTEADTGGARTNQDAIVFIVKTLRAHPNNTINWTTNFHDSNNIIEIYLEGNVLYVSSVSRHGSNLQSTESDYSLWMIDLSKVRIVDNKIYADNKNDIGWSYIPNVSGRKTITDDQLKKQGFRAIGEFVITRYYPSQTDDERFYNDHYDNRIMEAFKFLIENNGGGKIQTKAGEKF